MSGLEPFGLKCCRTAPSRSHCSAFRHEYLVASSSTGRAPAYSPCGNSIAFGKLLTAVVVGSYTNLESKTKRTSFDVLFVLAPQVGLEPTSCCNIGSVCASSRLPITVLLPLLFPRFFCHRQRSETSPRVRKAARRFVGSYSIFRRQNKKDIV